ncbi:type IV-A pilus assembly ATPase PilB [Myxococcota bacterium]|nr:type IV-A pilus assembly ATPase PilB [Myxococcota bacterium]
MSSRLGDILLRESLITPVQLKQAQDEQKKTGKRLGYTLAKMGALDEQSLTSFVAQHYGVPPVELRQTDIDPEVVKLLPENVARRHQVIPINRTGSTLVVAMADPSDIYAIDDLKFITGYNIEVMVASDTSIEEVLNRIYTSSMAALEESLYEFNNNEVEFGDNVDESVNVLDLEKASEEAPVIRLVNYILLSAIKKGASDIHVEPYEKSFRVRLRIDGVLHEEMTPPMRLKNAITSRLKIMSNLDIAERRLPQDGRIKLKIGKNKEMDFRVSVLPTLFGEKVVMRLLDKSNLQLDMTKLGFETTALDLFKKAIYQPYGMVLVTGPTGSGKTTTLYSALSELNQIDKNISTAEDPVEFNLHGINQVHIHDDIGLDFAAALRAFLRQDPDIIMVGEIRDFETAEIGVKAALTGHLVLSTLHTNDAPSTINRLLNMGVEPFLVTASVNLIVAQRLARKICNECREPFVVPKETLVDMGVPEEQAAQIKHVFKGKGCPHCSNTGYKGRVALYEVMWLYDELKDMIIQGSSAAELKATAIRLGLKTLRMSGISKIIEGVTTIEEVTRVTASD